MERLQIPPTVSPIPGIEPFIQMFSKNTHAEDVTKHDTFRAGRGGREGGQQGGGRTDLMVEMSPIHTSQSLSSSRAERRTQGFLNYLNPDLLGVINSIYSLCVGEALGKQRSHHDLLANKSLYPHLQHLQLPRELLLDLITSHRQNNPEKTPRHSSARAQSYGEM